MATLRFTKMHGAGNDFVMLNNVSGMLDLNSSLIKYLEKSGYVVTRFNPYQEG